jgi:hypothetical protein
MVLTRQYKELGRDEKGWIIQFTHAEHNTKGFIDQRQELPVLFTKTYICGVYRGVGGRSKVHEHGLASGIHVKAKGQVYGP